MSKRNTLHRAAFYFVSIPLLWILSVCAAPAEDVVPDPDVAKLLLSIDPEEQKQLPQPSRLNPSYWNFPGYAKTPFLCIGDDVVGRFATSMFAKTRGQINLHVVSQGYLSVTVSEDDINAIDVVQLNPSARDTLRTMLRLAVRDIETGQSARQKFVYIANNPVISSRLTGKPAKVLAWTLYLAGILLDQTIERESSDVKARLTLLADQLQSTTRLYRSVVLVGSGSQSFVRYLYAIQPQDRELTVLRYCLYPRR